MSAKTNRYYHFNSGVDRVLEEGNPENVWYYTFLQDPKEYALNIDNDEVQSANNEINIFINCKIYSPAGEVMGVVGVGFGVDTMQQIFRGYEEAFQLRAYLVDRQGAIEISTTKAGYEKTDFSEGIAYGAYRQPFLSGRGGPQSYWYAAGRDRGGVARYIPNLEWHLIVDNDTAALEASLNRQFFISEAVVASVIAAALLIITGTFRKYNAQIVSLTVEKEKLHRTAFQTETEKLYENIYENDVTHNRAASEAAESYFESLGAAKKLPFDKALGVIARQQKKRGIPRRLHQYLSPKKTCWGPTGRAARACATTS